MCSVPLHIQLASICSYVYVYVYALWNSSLLQKN